ncbi:hypothetical protein [uncultured Gammaproteobacteria bacterium]|nr:hypothetical protein [uncultured Gammaproteobacteria bacterium]
MHSVGARAFCAKKLNKIHEYLFLWNSPALIEYIASQFSNNWV